MPLSTGTGGSISPTPSVSRPQCAQKGSLGPRRLISFSQVFLSQCFSPHPDCNRNSLSLESNRCECHECTGICRISTGAQSQTEPRNRMAVPVLPNLPTKKEGQNPSLALQYQYRYYNGTGTTMVSVLQRRRCHNANGSTLSRHLAPANNLKRPWPCAMTDFPSVNRADTVF